MKKFYLALISISLIAACSGLAFAAEFTPLNFEGASYSSSSSGTRITASSTTSTVSSAAQAAAAAVDTTGSKNMQSAISQLDNAQVEVRNELLNYKTKYSEVDARYNAVKSERAELAKQIKTCEKKISQLDKAKDKIRKNME